MGDADAEIETLAEELRRLKRQLADSYWQDARVQELQRRLRLAIGSYGAWADDKPPLNRRVRVAAGYEQACAHLLWPGRADDGAEPR